MPKTGALEFPCHFYELKKRNDICEKNLILKRRWPLCKVAKSIKLRVINYSIISMMWMIGSTVVSDMALDYAKPDLHLFELERYGDREVIQRFRMVFHDQGASWFLAQLKPNCSGVAQKNLKRQGFKTFLPLEEETRQRNGKLVTATRPLFPGYIFVAFDVARGHWGAVNSTHGVTKLVSFGKEPAEVPLNLVSQLMLRCDSHGKLLPPKLLKPGDQVLLTKGPFANFAAEVEGVASDRRVWVLMEIMGAQTKVAVKADQLKAV